ncbi:MAG: hypothetical protein K0Q87_2568 [Neobacillus sp.]|jgi:hypothetical protein|nr:hypothetical protein [Neobacillus sp.]
MEPYGKLVRKGFSRLDSNIGRDSLDDMVIEFKFGQVSVTKAGDCPKEDQVRPS